jgi:ribosome-binding factor A
MTTRRIERVNHLLREELALLILRSAKDPRLAPVSIMAVKVTSDLKYATVYVRAGGDEEALAEALLGLESAEGYLRRELGRRLRPDLEKEYESDRQPSSSEEIEGEREGE